MITWVDEFLDLRKRLSTMMAHLPPTEAYAIAVAVEKLGKGAKEEYAQEILGSLAEDVSDAEEKPVFSTAGGVIKVQSRKDVRYREEDVCAALESAGIEESAVYEWVRTRVLSPSKVDQLVQNGHLDASVTAPRISTYLRASIDFDKV